jgi:hypothetical protein
MDLSSLLGQVSPQTIQQAQSQQLQQGLQGAAIQNQQIQAQSAQQDLQNRKLGLGISMLTPILNEPDPDKQQSLINRMVPIFNRYVPDMQLDPDNTDVSTIPGTASPDAAATHDGYGRHRRFSGDWHIPEQQSGAIVVVLAAAGKCASNVRCWNCGIFTGRTRRERYTAPSQARSNRRRHEFP